MRIRITKWQKRCIAFFFDVSVTLVAWIWASWLLSNPLIKNINSTAFLITFVIQCSLYLMCGLYRGVWRFASVPDLIRILRAVFFGSVLNMMLLILIDDVYPVKFYIINGLLLITLLSSGRFIFRLYSDYPKLSLSYKPILVVGAGAAGEGLIRDLYRSSMHYKYYPVALVDDNPLKQGSELQGVRIVGQCKDIPKVVAQYNIELILIAIPSLSSRRMRSIVSYCEKANVPFRTLPGLKAIADGNVKVDALREVQLEDLLGREQVNHDLTRVRALIDKKTILVTGGGGSIGSELCRQILQLTPTSLIIVDNNEYNLYSIDLELRKTNLTCNLHIHLCDVTDEVEIENIFNLYKPDIVFHVAAYKHVPLLENHIRVAMQNNILGTKMVATLASKMQVKNFVLISTDKAVNPRNIMGATKRAAEIFCQTLNLYSNTQFITVRFGNVLDSAGSVIPLFRRQLQNGGPLTVTHPEITRYFMTIPEAAQLIMQAATLNDEGEIFVLDMGEPICIRYLAEQMIKLSGKVVGQDIQIVYTGLRPGEKLYEELFHQAEYIGGTSHAKINQAQARHFDWQRLEKIMESIQFACKENNNSELRLLLNQLVPEYHAEEDIQQAHVEEASLVY